VREGEYLLAVRGKDVRSPANVYSFFENTSGKIVEITVGPNADGSGVSNRIGRPDWERSRPAETAIGWNAI
jgi:hypothetical protein